MSWTKRQFIEAAHEELGLADFVQPSQLESAMRRLDTMMASWNSRGIRIGFPIPSSPEDSDLDTETTVPDSANEAIILGLAMRLAPTFGKQVSQETKMLAKEAYSNLTSLHARPLSMSRPDNLLLGAGNKGNVFVGEADEQIQIGGDDELEFA